MMVVWVWGMMVCGLDVFEYQCVVGIVKVEVVGYDYIYFLLVCYVGYVIQVVVFVWLLQVDGWWNDVVVQCQY